LKRFLRNRTKEKTPPAYCCQATAPEQTPKKRLDFIEREREIESGRVDKSETSWEK
jgi:hypothetical protein